MKQHPVTCTILDPFFSNLYHLLLKKSVLLMHFSERYRDLIDAADTIGEMKQCSDKVCMQK